jgi:methyl-accepting chemotaxis protein
MTVAQRLYLLVFSAVLGLLSLAGLGMLQMNRIYVSTNYANVNTVPRLLTLDEASRPVAQLLVDIWQYMALNDVAKRTEMEQIMRTEHAKVIGALNKFESGVSGEQDKRLLAADRAALAEYDALREKVLALVASGNAWQARDLMFANQAVITKFDNALDRHRQYNADLGKQGAEAAAGILGGAIRLALLIAVLVIVGVAGMGLMLVRKIVNSLNAAVQIAQTVARGDLSAHIVVTSGDETGQLLQALKAMNDSLVNIVAEVRSGTDTIAAASGRILSGNLSLSARTQQQAGALEETAAAMGELTDTVKQNAGHARQANALAVSASAAAVNGGTVVSQVVDTMHSIDASAKKIVDIISMIDGIAFQTNILALNAAVEAARAGEQGRGFAVVASEVRNLAQRSAAAAREIKTLIDDSVEKVGTGARLVGQLGTTTQEIVDSVQRVTGIMGEITAATQQQASGVEQVNQAISQMEQATRQNAALVEEAAGAAGFMQEQAGNLVQTVSVFKLDDGAQQTARGLAGQAPAPAVPMLMAKVF